MRKTLPLFASAVVAAALCSGCANVEKKFARGLNNTFEIVRMGELRRTMEEHGVFEGHDQAMSIGFVRGLNRTLARTGIGIYEMVSAPFPSYDPICTDYLNPRPVYPDNYTPDIPASSVFATDTSLGYSGGDVLPIVPGSRFRIFDTH